MPKGDQFTQICCNEVHKQNRRKKKRTDKKFKAVLRQNIGLSSPPKHAENSLGLNKDNKKKLLNAKTLIPTQILTILLRLQYTFHPLKNPSGSHHWFYRLERMSQPMPIITALIKHNMKPNSTPLQA